MEEKAEDEYSDVMTPFEGLSSESGDSGFGERSPPSLTNANQPIRQPSEDSASIQDLLATMRRDGIIQ
jgi:hypothetical protein